MFDTIGNTIELVRLSWRILMRDKALLIFPVLSGAGVAAVLIFGGLTFYSAGLFDRLNDGQHPGLLDAVMLFLFYLVDSFVIIYFNSALVAAVNEQLEGREGGVRVGLEIASDRLGAIFGWSLVAATVAFVLRQIVDEQGFFGKIVATLLGAAWSFLTFFVVPVLVIEGTGPLEALAKSSDLMGKTWGKNLVANFGFGLAYFVLVVLAAIPALLALVVTGSETAAIVAGILLTLPAIVFGIVVLKAMEGVFTVALYHYASGGKDGPFPQQMLRGAYVSKGEKGSWGSPTFGV